MGADAGVGDQLEEQAAFADHHEAATSSGSTGTRSVRPALPDATTIHFLKLCRIIQRSFVEESIKDLTVTIAGMNRSVQ